MYLLDTNVVSELRKAAPKGNRNVLAWAATVPARSLYISAITVLELETGVLLVTRRDRRQGQVLRSWLDIQVLPAFTDRILPVDVAAALQCAKLHVPNRRPDRDALIAATALVHGMAVVTGNISDFAPMEVATVNPWEALP